MESLITKVLLFLSPAVKFINKTFTLPSTIKKIRGDHYYLWRDLITSGTVLLTSTDGAGSNLINLSKINHSGIYFGKGLRTAIEAFIEVSNGKQKTRLESFLKKYNPSDDICYVIEATGHGVVCTNLVTFITTKDYIKAMKPSFCGQELMEKAALEAVCDLGLPYDYGFSHRDDAKYCFEVCADAYEQAINDIKLKRFPIKIFGFELYDTFLSSTFETGMWSVLFDSQLTEYDLHI